MLVEAALLLTAARIRLASRPFRDVARKFGEPGNPLPSSIGVRRCDPALLRTVRSVAWAVRIAARVLPFDAVCLPQGIAGKAMLRRRGISSVLHFGVSRHGTDAERAAAAISPAHAWLEAEGCRVTGYPVEDRYVEVASFI